MGKALDTFQCSQAVANADKLVQEGFTAIGLYYFHASKYKQLLTRAFAAALSAKGLYVFSIWEDGSPTHTGYFSESQGKIDGTRALSCAQAAGQPDGTPIYATVDYDAAPSDIAAILAYFQAFRAALGPHYTVGTYGSGLVCARLKAAGLVSHTWLTQSKGFACYYQWLHEADIVQGPVTQVLGMDADLDTTNGHAGGWQVAA